MERSTATRELPVGARQQAEAFHITSELRTEPRKGSRLRRVRPIQRARVLIYGSEQEWYRRGLDTFVS